MATVINLPKDTRASDLGKGISSFLDRMKDRRIDGLQQELMASIGNSKDEAEATAFMGDPKYQEVVTDNERFSAVVTHFNNAPLGTQPVTGYDEFGEQKIISVREGDDVVEAMRNAKLTPERKRMFYSTQLGDNLSSMIPVGRFGSAQAAKNAATTEDILGNRIFLDEESTINLQTMRSSNASLMDQRAARYLAQEKFQFTKAGGHSPFANLQQDIRDGKFATPEDEAAAWKRMTFIWGRSGPDIKLQYRNDLIPEGAQIQATSETMIKAMKMVEADQNIITGISILPKAWNAVAAEVSTLAGGLGLYANPVESYNPWFEENNLGSRSTAFKSMITTLALSVAAAHGQSNRALSDKDFDRFLEIVGANISDGATFITNMNLGMQVMQNQFSSRYTTMTSDFQTGTIGNWEAEFRPFPTFGTDKTKAEDAQTWVDLHPGYSIVLPGVHDINSPNFVPPAEHK